MHQSLAVRHPTLLVRALGRIPRPEIIFGNWRSISPTTTCTNTRSPLHTPCHHTPITRFDRCCHGGRDSWLQSYTSKRSTDQGPFSGWETTTDGLSDIMNMVDPSTQSALLKG
jgi:hypothetical protein